MKDVVIGPDDGTLLLKTTVEGRLASMGHRLTIEMKQWGATVTFADNEPVSANLHIDVAGLRVISGAGGVKPLSGPEKSYVRSNALASLDAERFPEIAFAANVITRSEHGYLLTGDLSIRDVTRAAEVDVVVTDEGFDWLLEVDTNVRQTEFGVTPYSLMLGSLRVSDTVHVTFRARVSQGS